LLPRGAFNLYYQVVSELDEPPKYEAIRQCLANVILAGGARISGADAVGRQ
jgi:hypothetical protein